ncbi:MAG: tRNA dihydrouridine synthase DusB [Cyanobacteria bacterium SIG30]|nr:tRNA dihydrouridine synthase DusB [Cyanobacteria bacterium SIG30]
MKKQIDIKKIKVIQAPLAGISDCVYRGLTRKYSSTCLLSTEMLSAEALNNCPNPKGAILKFDEKEYPLSFQLVGHKPKMIAKCAKLLEERASVIDLNFGCPVNKVIKSGDGSAMMKTPELAQEIIYEVRNAVNIPISAKFRLGWSRDNENYVDFAKRMENAGANFITIHGRFRSDLYSGISDWEKIGKLKNEIKIPYFANGDIKTLDDAIKCLDVSKANGVSIGRGIMGDFTLPYRIEQYLETGKKIDEPSFKEKIEMLKTHLKQEVELRGEKNGVKFMRKFYNFYISSLKNASKYRQVLVVLESLKEIEEVLDDVLCLSSAN